MMDERTTAKFLRGLTMGAIIGAMIAGSALWQRRRPPHRPPGDQAPSDPAPPPAGVTERLRVRPSA
jgi:hypothetical protein